MLLKSNFALKKYNESLQAILFHNLYNKNTLKQSSLVIKKLNVVTWSRNPFVIGLVYKCNINIKNYSNLRI